jgi:phytoene dehydrogenase-like protein
MTARKRNAISIKLLIAAMSALGLFGACSSLARGFGQTESEPITTEYQAFRKQRRPLYIQNFENRTYSPQLTGRLKDKLQTAYTRLRSVSVTPEKDQAQLILYGKILLYAEEPGVYDRSAAPLTYNLSIVASIRIRARGSNEEDSEPYEQHTIRYGTTYTIGEPLFESRYIAEERLLDGLADRIVNTTYEPEDLK